MKFKKRTDGAFDSKNLYIAFYDGLISVAIKTRHRKFAHKFFREVISKAKNVNSNELLCTQREYYIFYCFPRPQFEKYVNAIIIGARLKHVVQQYIDDQAV